MLPISGQNICQPACHLLIHSCLEIMTKSYLAAGGGRTFVFVKKGKEVKMFAGRHGWLPSTTLDTQLCGGVHFHGI